MTLANDLFQKTAGMKALCRSFTQEINEKGELSERGENSIDEFVRLVNSKITKRDGNYTLPTSKD